MIDLNHRGINEKINYLIDAACIARRDKQTPRQYLGGSRLGVECERALQFEFLSAPKDDGADFKGQTIRIFDAGHLYEDLAIRWIREAGFDLRTEAEDGGQFGFETASGKIKGHVDGILVGGPDAIQYPALWECKSMKDKKWKECIKGGVAKSHPVYAAQCQVYMAYMGLTEHPAIFTSVNKDTQEIWFEAIPYNDRVAQALSEKGHRIVEACHAGELLPRIASSSDSFGCKWCSWKERCWRLES